MLHKSQHEEYNSFSTIMNLYAKPFKEYLTMLMFCCVLVVYNIVSRMSDFSHQRRIVHAQLSWGSPIKATTHSRFALNVKLNVTFIYGVCTVSLRLASLNVQSCQFHIKNAVSVLLSRKLKQKDNKWKQTITLNKYTRVWTYWKHLGNLNSKYMKYIKFRG